MRVCILPVESFELVVTPQNLHIWIHKSHSSSTIVFSQSVFILKLGVVAWTVVKWVGVGGLWVVWVGEGRLSFVMRNNLFLFQQHVLWSMKTPHTGQGFVSTLFCRFVFFSCVRGFRIYLIPNWLWIAICGIVWNSNAFCRVCSTGGMIWTRIPRVATNCQRLGSPICSFSYTLYLLSSSSVRVCAPLPSPRENFAHLF